jgi:hypothetical protein
MDVFRNARALFAFVAVANAACSSGSPAPAAPESDAGAPAETVRPAVYVAKVKNLLVGLAPTGAEIEAVEADPARLGALVDDWMKLPEYEGKMMRFFELAFQQTRVGPNDFLDQIFAQVGINDTTTPLLLRNVEESFARTMVRLVAEDRPLTEAMTTKRLMMTTALKEFYAFLDTVEIDNDGKIYDRFRAQIHPLPIVVGAAQGPIPIEQTLDPTSPNFMHWYDPDVATAYVDVPGCQEDPVLLSPVALGLHYLLLGSIDARKLRTGDLCPRYGGTATAAQLKPNDFSDWTMTTIRPPQTGEATTTFYDLPRLRSASELVLSVPRVGFFSTPAFFANWHTNASNQMRVTLNQTLIVATGFSIDGTDATVAPGSPGLDAVHADQPVCYTCHNTLDPTRSILSASWSWSYRRQQDPAWTAQPGAFAFRGVVESVSSLEDFGAVLGKHPLVASGWVQKLCYYLNSTPCDDQDPEFSRIVDLFRSSGFAWNTLVKELVTSPLTTYASETRTLRTNGGAVVSVSRRDHLCAALDARLGFDDVCAIGATGPALAKTMPLIVSGLPSDAYGRGAVVPILPNEPTLFFRAGIENMCADVAEQVVDAPAAPAGAKQWSSAEPDAAIRDFVSVVMALAPSDPRSAPAIDLLTSHFMSALAEPGIGATEALRSTFVVACLAPSTLSIGL